MNREYSRHLLPGLSSKKTPRNGMLRGVFFHCEYSQFRSVPQ